MKTANERKAAERQRRKDAGLVRMELWIPPHLRTLIQKTALQMVAEDAENAKLGKHALIKCEP